MHRPGSPGWRLGAGLTIQPCKTVTVTKHQKGEARARPDDDDDDDEQQIYIPHLLLSSPLIVINLSHLFMTSATSLTSLRI
jgi:hypothetical protein